MGKINKKHIVLILPDIRSAENVGAIFRTGDAVGVAHVYITGYTPCPVDKFGRARNDISKTALGAEQTIPWSFHKSTTMLIKKLKKDGYTIVGLEQDERATDYKKYRVSSATALILGNEVLGIDKKIRASCDALIEIPMKGEKESLNVSVATGVALFRILGI